MNWGLVSGLCGAGATDTAEGLDRRASAASQGHSSWQGICGMEIMLGQSAAACSDTIVRAAASPAAPSWPSSQGKGKGRSLNPFPPFDPLADKQRLIKK